MTATAVFGWRSGLVVVVTLALGGCGGGAGGGAPVGLANLPGAWAQAVCDQNFKCATADIMDRTKADCVQTNTTVWQVLTGSVQDGQSKGRVAYDAGQAGACLQALRGETCAEWVTGLAHDVWCPEAFTAKVAVGGVCQSDVECTGGICDGADLSAMPPVEGTCKARVAHAAACTLGDSCVTSDYCDGVTNVCTSKKAGGATCASDDECVNSCNPDTSKCSGYAGCAVAPVTAGGTLLSVLFTLALGLVAGSARRRRR